MDSRRLSRASRRFEDLDQPPIAFEHADTPTTSDTLDSGLVRNLMSHMAVGDGSAAGGSPHSARLEASGSGLLPSASDSAMLPSGSGSLEAAQDHRTVPDWPPNGRQQQQQQAHPQHTAGPARERGDDALVQQYAP